MSSGDDDAPIGSSIRRAAAARKPIIDSDSDALISSKKKKQKVTRTPVKAEKKIKPAPAKTSKRSPAKPAAPRKTAVKKVKEEEEEQLVPGDARKYFKEGQKYITPPNGDGTRGFYESLYDEKPNSLCAIRYCVEYGVLTGTKHHEALARFSVLKEMGAYKGMPGGLKDFKAGQPKELLQKYEAVIAPVKIKA